MKLAKNILRNIPFIKNKKWDLILSKLKQVWSQKQAWFQKQIQLIIQSVLIKI
jgi:hypothetical protein